MLSCWKKNAKNPTMILLLCWALNQTKMHEFLCLITKSNTTFHELSKSYKIDAILSQIEGENSKYIFGPSSSVMTVDPDA